MNLFGRLMFMINASIKGDLQKLRLCALKRPDLKFHGVIYAARHGHLPCVRFMEPLSSFNDIGLAFDAAGCENHLAIARYILDCGHPVNTSVFSGDHMRLPFPLKLRQYLVWRYSGHSCHRCNVYVCSKPAMCWFLESLPGCRCECWYCK